MVASKIFPGPVLSKKINIICLLVTIVIVLVLPFKKEIWYDETVSILCSKGISHDTPGLFANTNTLSSATLQQLNDTKHVFNATVVDNANSFLYNISLHWFTSLFGNTITAYTLFSKLCAIAALLSLFFLSRLMLKDHLFTAAAVLLLGVDYGFISISHELRSYTMAIFFVTMAAAWGYKFLFQNGKPLYLFVTAAFSVAAIMSHFLSIYIVLVLFGSLLAFKSNALYYVKNIAALLVPVAFLALFLFYSRSGLKIMGHQNQDIQQAHATSHFNMKYVVFRSIRFTAINFKAIYPAVRNYKTVSILSFLLVIALYITGIKVANDKTERRNLHWLFILGVSSSVFLALLCVRSHHYTSLYYRYYSFGIPFCSLFVAWALYLCIKSSKVNKLIKYSLPVLVIGPVLILSVLQVRKDIPEVKYNHAAIAEEITRNKIDKLDVPDWRDALLVQSLLPNGYKIDYFRNPDVPFFVLHSATSEERIPVIRQDQQGNVKTP
jgi:hypothetical protein